jgi:GAF domain
MMVAAPQPQLAAVPAVVLSALATVLQESDQPGATLRLLDRCLDELVGHKLFTVLLYRPLLGVAVRLYSSKPDLFPATGAKALDEAPTMKAVLTGGRPYIGKTPQDIKRDFPDHEKIFALGCGSILNVPICWQGDVLGQINILNRAGHFDEGHLAIVERLARSVAPAFVAASHGQSEETS